MKKLIIFLLVAFLGFATFAQEIERPSSSEYNIFSKNTQKINYSYWDYEGISTDLLIPTTSDTLHIRYHVKKHRPYTVKIMSKFDPISGADTIVYINLLGRNSTDENWTSILTDSTAVIDADGVTKTISSLMSPTITIGAFDVPFTNPTSATADTLEFPEQTYTYTSPYLEYRYLLVEYILAGDDSIGTGVELKRSEIKIVEH